ncbi:MAG: transglycosylase SLT domain-containing protein [Myxococcota bacterium]|nr:transglycosylase SLT domain-containing protein [Myxococcota bacterium]
MLTPFLIAALLAAPAQASLSLASPDLAELLRRETESAAERNLWLTFRTGQLATARRAFQRGQYRKSLQLLERWLKRHPKAESVNPVRFLSASAELRLKRHERCAESFQRLAADYPALRDASLLGLARCRLGQGHVASAIDVLEAIPNDSAEAAEADALLVWTRYQSASHAELLDELSERHRRNEVLKPVSRYVYGLLLRDAKQISDAAFTFRTLIRDEPLSSFTGPALLDLSALRGQRGFLYSKAERRVVATMRKRLINYRGYGPDRTLKKLHLALRRVPKSRLKGEVALARAKASERHRNWTSAVHRYTQATRDARDTTSRAHAYYGLGDMQNRRGKYRAARAAFGKVAQYAASAEVGEAATFAIADMDARLGRFHKARKELTAIMVRNPLTGNRARILWSLGWIHYREANYAEALRLFESLLKEGVRGGVGEGRDRTLYWAGRTALKTSDAERARRYFGELLRDYPVNYYTSSLLDFVAIRGFSVKPAAEATKAVTLGSDAPLVKAEGLARAGIRNAARKGLSQYLSSVLPKQLGRASQRSFAGSVRLAPINEPSSQQLERVSALLEQLNRSGRARWLRGLQAAGELPPLTPTQRDKWLKEAHPRPFWYAVRKWGKRHRVDPMLMYALIRQESQFNPRAISSADALGLMQIIPPTAKQIAGWLRIRNPSRKSMLEPNLNIRLGSRYLAYLLKRYRGRVAHAIAAYNAGPMRVDRWKRRHQGRPIDEWVEEIPFDETRDYVKRVLSGYIGYRMRFGVENSSVMATSAPERGRR